MQALGMLTRMCMLCMDYTWRTVMIAMVGIVICAAICVIVYINEKEIQQIIHKVSWMHYMQYIIGRSFLPDS